MGHINRYTLKLLGLLLNKNICKSCIEGKSTRKPFNKSGKTSTQIGHFIHSDISAPVVTPTKEGYTFFQVFLMIIHIW